MTVFRGKIVILDKNAIDIKNCDIHKISKLSNRLQEFKVDGIDKNDFLVEVCVFNDSSIWTNVSETEIKRILETYAIDSDTLNLHRNFCKGLPVELIKKIGLENLLYNTFNNEMYPMFPNYLPVSVLENFKYGDVLTIYMSRDVSIELTYVK